MKKKTWVKPKNKIVFCGYCEVCNKQLYSDTGGWIVNAERKSFCQVLKQLEKCHNRKLPSLFQVLLQANLARIRGQALLVQCIFVIVLHSWTLGSLPLCHNILLHNNFLCSFNHLSFYYCLKLIKMYA